MGIFDFLNNKKKEKARQEQLRLQEEKRRAEEQRRLAEQRKRMEQKEAQSEIPVHLLNYQVSIVKVKRIV